MGWLRHGYEHWTVGSLHKLHRHAVQRRHAGCSGCGQWHLLHLNVHLSWMRLRRRRLWCAGSSGGCGRSCCGCSCTLLLLLLLVLLGVRWSNGQSNAAQYARDELAEVGALAGA